MNRIITVILISWFVLFSACKGEGKQIDSIMENEMDSTNIVEHEHPVRKSLLIEIDKKKETLSDWGLNEELLFFYVFFYEENGRDYLQITEDIRPPTEWEEYLFSFIKYNNNYILFYTELDDKYKEYVSPQFLSRF